MAFVFDSLAALLLFAAAVIAWRLAGASRISSRINIRFAGLLLAALAAARALGMVLPQFLSLAPAVAPIAASLGTVALALGLLAVLARPVPPLAASLALALALGAGLAAALSGEPIYALGCQILGVCLTFAVALSRFAAGAGRASLALLAAAALFCGGLALMDGAINVAELFFAAGLIGAARVSQFRVEAQ
jgi:3-deoxy-D-manno-octulosonic-acid transferase